MVDIDGVISLFGAPSIANRRAPGAARVGEERDAQALEGRFCSVDGAFHFLSYDAAAHLLALADSYELVWASGWEEKANEHLPHLLGMPPELPFLRFSHDVAQASAAGTHWKLEAIDRYAGERPLAWIDDGFNEACHEWAGARRAPTLLVPTEPQHGLTAREARELKMWARELARP